MLIQYNGPHPEVVVDEFNSEQVIVNGQPVEIPEELAVRLLQQDTWGPGNGQTVVVPQAQAPAADAQVAADARTIDASVPDTSTEGNS